MITKFKIYEQSSYSSMKIFENLDLIDKIKSVLTPDLLKGMWKQEFENPLEGHCYAATEALYWMLGGPNSDWKPYVLSHKTFPEGLNEGETHWFLKNQKTNEILDPTEEQFEGVTIKYENGISNGMMNHPYGGSKRAKEIIRRVNLLEHVNESFELSGKFSFNTFLQIISNHDYHFVLNDLYTKLYDYHLFFSTETIKEVEDFIDAFKYKQSLPAASTLLLEIGSNKLAFFFGIKESTLLRYGFVDLDTQRSYVVGEFNISDRYFDSIVKYKALRFINKTLYSLNVKNLSTLSKIKNDFENFYSDKKGTKIKIVNNKVIKYFNRDQFSEEDFNMNRLFRSLDQWIMKKPWRNRVECSVDDTEDPIQFIIIAK